MAPEMAPWAVMALYPLPAMKIMMTKMMNILDHKSFYYFHPTSRSSTVILLLLSRCKQGMGSRDGPDLLNQQNNKHDFQKEKKEK